MKILMITPAAPRSRYGNRVTALRWRRLLLLELKHQVELAQHYQGQSCELMIALHAQRSHAAMVAYRERHPGAPLVLALTGTDLYQDLKNRSEARLSLRMANLLVALQPLAAQELPASLRPRLRVILQSATPPPTTPQPSRRYFSVCVVGHLREVKDPFRCALAARELPADSQIRVLHAGQAMQPAMAQQARAEEATNPRYRWLGELPRWKVRRLLARTQVMVLSSFMEGGANTISEAAAAGLPVLASRIPGSVGLLGRDYPGYFPPGNTAALRRLLLRTEREEGFRNRLRHHIEALAPRFTPAREREAWRALLEELKVEN